MWFSSPKLKIKYIIWSSYCVIKKSILCQQQSCSLKCCLPWSAGSPEAEQIPLSAGISRVSATSVPGPRKYLPLFSLPCGFFSEGAEQTGAGRGAGSVIQGLWGCFVLYALNLSVRTNGAMEVAFVTVTEPGWIFLQSSASPLFKVSPTYERPGVCLDSCQNVDYGD